jgi:DNA integrity scanning protein DisA with diadenylate cyclase activity
MVSSGQGRSNMTVAASLGMTVIFYISSSDKIISLYSSENNHQLIDAFSQLYIDAQRKPCVD